MSEQIQQLQNEILVLKGRILDTQDIASQEQQKSKILTDTFTEIISIIGLQSETGEVKLNDVVDVIRALVADNEPAEPIESE